MEVRTDPRVRPVPVAAEVVAVSEKGVAEAAGFPKPRLNPVEAAVEVVRLPTNTQKQKKLEISIACLTVLTSGSQSKRSRGLRKKIIFLRI